MYKAHVPRLSRQLGKAGGAVGTRAKMRSALYICLVASLLYGMALCDHHEGHHKRHGDHGKKDKADHSHHHGHHQGGDGHHHHHNASDNMTCHRIASALSDFTFNLFNQSASTGDSHNIFFSPVSIATAFAMLSVGAKHDTLNEILQGMSFNLTDLSVADIHEGFHHLIHMLSSADRELQLSMGNALFIRQNLKLLQSFLDEVKNKYESEAFSTDFENEEEAKKQINDYVEKHTNGKIVDMIKDLDKATVMVLVNYIFFKGKWEKPFNVESTKEDDFHVDQHTIVKVPMMFRSGMYNMVTDSELSCTVITVPYKGGASALLILPDEGKMKQVQDAFSRTTIKKWIKSMHHSSVNIFVPKFSISTTMDLKEMFAGLGITDVFSDHADLSGITGAPDIKASKAVHKAVLSIDEKGTEAAGTTTIEIMPMSLPPTIKFNHPFILMIYHKETRSTLFMGRIVNPIAK